MDHGVQKEDISSGKQLSVEAASMTACSISEFKFNFLCISFGRELRVQPKCYVLFLRQNTPNASSRAVLAEPIVFISEGSIQLLICFLNFHRNSPYYKHVASRVCLFFLFQHFSQQGSTITSVRINTLCQNPFSTQRF